MLLTTEAAVAAAATKAARDSDEATAAPAKLQPPDDVRACPGGAARFHGILSVPRPEDAAMLHGARAALLIGLLTLPGCFSCECNPPLVIDNCPILDLEDCALICCGGRGICSYEDVLCLWDAGEPCESGVECLSGLCVGGVCGDCSGDPCGLECCDSGQACVNGECTVAPTASGCQPLPPGVPTEQGDIGQCCDTRWPMMGGPCIGGLSCLNGWCTEAGCTSDAQCDRVVGDGERSPFPKGTSFACLAAGSGAISFCAPVGSTVRVCGTGAECDGGESCVFALDPASMVNQISGVCLTSFAGGAATGSACFVASERPCAADGDCRGAIGPTAEPVERCEDGLCALTYPISRYQCEGAAGIFEVVPCGNSPSCDGPGGLFDGGCFAGFFSEAGACAEACDPAAQNCPFGLECADLFGVGVGVCTGAECARSEGPIDVSHPVWGAGAASPDVLCTTSADCPNGGLDGARCIGGTCELINRVLSCPMGSFCSTVLATDEFPQGISDMDALGRTERDAYTLHCAPAVPFATLAPGDPCTDSSECTSGMCDIDLFDSAQPIGRCTHPCATDVDCPAGLHCIDLELPLSPGTSTRMPLCLDVSIFGLETCTAEAPCPMTLGCAPWSSRAAVGICFAQFGAVEGFIDNLTVGSTCDADLNRCLPGEDGTLESTSDDAAAAACVGDDRLVVGSNNCRSLRCYDANDLDGGAATSVNAACSAVCRANADCDIWSRCRSVLQNDNSTGALSDDNWLGLCLTFRPAATTACTAGSCAATEECDDGDLPSELGTGGCYSPNAEIGDACVAATECGYGGRCIPASDSPGGYCTMHGCAFDEVTGIGDGADCTGTAGASRCWSEHGDAGLCVAVCDTGNPCRPGYTCSALLGSTDTVCLP